MRCIPIRSKGGDIACDRCGVPLPATDAELALFPGCASTLDCLKSNCVGLGLGDRVERVLRFFGITPYRVSKWLGRDCRCASKREGLNRWGWHFAKALGRPRNRRRGARGRFAEWNRRLT